jgi:small-conductance mechanosensitive channel
VAKGQFMFATINPLLISAAATAVVVAALNVPPLKIPFGRAAVRLMAFSLFTASLLHAGVYPNQEVAATDSAARHGVEQILVCFWWFGSAAIVNSVARATLRIRQRPERERLVQDLVTTAAYLLAALEVSSKVFGLPVGALLATSGAVAIVAGLALQSALGDAFCGLLLNLSRPYRLGDWIAVDASLEGRVIETNWRATHLMTAERSVAIVPNSALAKARFINTSVATPFRGVIVRLQLRPDVRPATVIAALERAATEHEDIARNPQPQITTVSSTVEFVQYEVQFFVDRAINESRAKNRYVDLAFLQLDSVGVDRTPTLPFRARPRLRARNQQKDRSDSLWSRT